MVNFAMRGSGQTKKPRSAGQHERGLAFTSAWETKPMLSMCAAMLGSIGATLCAFNGTFTVMKP